MTERTPNPLFKEFISMIPERGQVLQILGEIDNYALFHLRLNETDLNDPQNLKDICHHIKKSLRIDLMADYTLLTFQNKLVFTYLATYHPDALLSPNKKMRKAPIVHLENCLNCEGNERKEDPDYFNRLKMYALDCMFRHKHQERTMPIEKHKSTDHHLKTASTLSPSTIKTTRRI